MFDLDRWQEIYSTLRKNKMRTFLTAFGVFWGIFMLVVLQGAGRMLENGIAGSLGDFATNSAFMWAQTTTVAYKGFPKGRGFMFNNEDIKALRDNVSDIDLLAPRVQRGSSLVVYGLETGSYSINGDYPDFNQIDPVKISNGRFINQIDVDNYRKVAVIGRQVAEELFPADEDPIGQYIRIQGVYFQVIGVFTSERQQRRESTITIPFTTMQRAYNIGNQVYYFAMTAKPDVSVSKVLSQAKSLLQARHSISPDDREAIGAEDVEYEFQRITMLFSGINILVWIVGIGTLLAGVIGISNIMLIIVKERTHEIGIQRAIGATPRVIITQIMLEAIVLTTIAGYFGMVCGVGVVEAAAHIMANAPSENRMASLFVPEVQFVVAVRALMIIIFCGALAGLIPAYRAVKVKPIDALRYE